MKKSLIVIIIVSLLVIASALLIPFLQTNYDLTLYLPAESQTREGLERYEQEFGVQSSIQIQIDDVEISNVLLLKQSIQSVEHVLQVIWLDDYIDLNTVPLSMIPIEQLSLFYEEGDALLTVVMDQGSYDLDTETTINQIKTILTQETYAMRGEVINNIENRHIANQEVIKVTLIIIPILILILFLASSSWFEPVLVLLTLGIAVILNFGTNYFVTDISYITNTMALALQLALSIDYALFLIHRYREEREHTSDPKLAIKAAFKKTLPAVTASALTTVAGFVSLMFMRYKIGLDIGLVLSKGIVFSYLTTIIVLPILLVYFDKLIQKSRHQSWLKAPKKYIPFIAKMKYPLLILFCGILVIGIIFQSKTTYQYGENTHFDEDSVVYQDLEKMDQQFGIWNQMIILVPKDTVNQELSLIQDLSSIPHVVSVQSLYTTVDPLTPFDLIPSFILNQYVGTHYARIIISVDIQSENEALYTLSDTIDEKVSTHYTDDAYVIGQPAATTEIKDVVTDDAVLVTIISILAIFTILAITFKSVFIPILLVSIIQAAIWFNVSILYFANTQSLYIGYLVVMAIQLGATIDYAVLLTSRYLQNRQTYLPKIALQKAFKRSSLTIFISALVLALAGFIEGVFSDISAISEIGYLLGKGTLISFGFVFLFLPPLLLLLDKLFLRTQFHKHTSKK